MYALLLILFNSPHLFLPEKHQQLGGPVPTHMQKILDAHATDIDNLENSVVKFDWLPSYILKVQNHEYFRIAGAHQFNQAIKITNSDKLFVPITYTYESTTAQKFKYFAISELVVDSHDTITVEELKQLLRVAKKLKWVDPHSGNFIKTPDARIALIDTKLDYINVPTESLTNDYHLKMLITHKIRKFHKEFTPDAHNYVEKKHAQYLEKMRVSEHQYAQLMQQKKMKNLCMTFLRSCQKHISFDERTLC